MKSLAALLIIACATMVVAIASSATAIADGGKVQLSQIIDGRRITVFTSPTPLVTGPIDISFLVQDEASGQVIHHAELAVVCQHLDSNDRIQTLANHSDSTNKLLQSAKIVLSQPGRWEVQVNPNFPGRLSFPINLENPTVAGSWLMAVVVSPILFVALFLIREQIVGNRQNSNAQAD